MPTIRTRRPSRVRDAIAAGGVVLRDRDGTREVVLTGRHADGTWVFPKGTPDQGEEIEDTALREVEEETGYRCAIDKRFERVQYFFQRNGQLVKKTVAWFLMKPLEKTGEPDTEEILETAWVSKEEAVKRAVYKSDKKLLAKLK